jgi:hypothetical protein
MKTLSLLLFLSVSISVSGNNSSIPLPELPKYEKVSKIERMIPEEYRMLIARECIKYSIPLIVFIKHIKRESNFNAKAIHYNYKIDPITSENYIASIDQGIGQQNSLYHPEFVQLDNGGKEYDPMNPYEAIPVIAHHLYRLQKETNNWKLTIAAYNCGLYRATCGKELPKITQDHLAYVFGDSYGKVDTTRKT